MIRLKTYLRHNRIKIHSTNDTYEVLETISTKMILSGKKILSSPISAFEITGIVFAELCRETYSKIIKRWGRITATNVTRGQRPNESQKAVIIYMMKSVGEIASKMWPVV